jgi:hypothetical protein
MKLTKAACLVDKAPDVTIAQKRSKSKRYSTFNELIQSWVSLAMLHARKLAAPLFRNDSFSSYSSSTSLGFATNSSPFAPNLGISLLSVNSCG